MTIQSMVKGVNNIVTIVLKKLERAKQIRDVIYWRRLRKSQFQSLFLELWGGLKDFATIEKCFSIKKHNDVL